MRFLAWLNGITAALTLATFITLMGLHMSPDQTAVLSWINGASFATFMSSGIAFLHLDFHSNIR